MYSHIKMWEGDCPEGSVTFTAQTFKVGPFPGSVGAWIIGLDHRVVVACDQRITHEHLCRKLFRTTIQGGAPF
ncbi:hypothetical protein [Pseudomonas sp. 1152_12]|uniref:hypothetical protein n=1 Tax=Pseudomonas sp. 1152_12 TaxID=2604455 RepID=UPI0040642E7B